MAPWKTVELELTLKNQAWNSALFIGISLHAYLSDDDNDDEQPEQKWVSSKDGA